MTMGLSRFSTTALVAAVFAASAGCADITASVHHCNDGIDNDGDGLIDGADPGCARNGTREEPDPTECNDGIDNDGDGLIDYPDDPGCLSENSPSESALPLPACSDGIDNDGDGLIDYPYDPGCFLPLEDDESDPCGTELPGCPACADGIDNDGDGLIDYPSDPGCTHAGGADEFSLDPNACGGDISVQPFPDSGEIVGTLRRGAASLLESSMCGGDGTEAVYAVRVRDPSTVQLSTYHPTTTADTVLYLRSSCNDPTSELACNDNANSFATSSQLLVDLPTPGTYYLVVDSVAEAPTGGYRLRVNYYTLTNTPCDPSVPSCAPGQTCRTISPTTTRTLCLPPQCSDGYDNDGDGLIDYPFDPGCASRTDPSEADDCPHGPTCPECANQIDDDGDGYIDFPNDVIGCLAASDMVEADECIPGVPAYRYTSPVAGTTPPANSGNNNFIGSCRPSTSTSPSEIIYAIPVDRPLSEITFSTLGSTGNTALYVRRGVCGDASAEVACADLTGGESITLTNPPQDMYWVFVDGSTGSNLAYQLSITGKHRLGTPCDPDDIIFMCPDGYACSRTELTCVTTQCNNGIDDDGDGFIDYPFDPGCDSISDDDEADDCPAGPTCPRCGNQIDDDYDGATDFGTDPGCYAASDSDELDECVPGIPAYSYFGPVSGTTPLANSGNNNFVGSCRPSSSTAPSEIIYGVPVPWDLDSLTFSTLGSTGNTALYVRRGDCGDASAEVGCADLTGGGESITLSNPVKDTYWVFVDGSVSSNLPYQLRVTGSIAAGEACPLDDPTFTCTSGYACDRTTRTCRPAACKNGLDDDEDGLIDYPYDPGCDTPSDDDETDDCPHGLSCPACGNGLDDDLDGLIDFPADPGCFAASDTDELDECGPGSPVVLYPPGGVSDRTPLSTSGQNKFTGTCKPPTSTTPTEVIYGVPVGYDLSSITFSTVGSTGDTVLYVRRGVCSSQASELACADPGLGGELITLYNPAHGLYYVFVDGDTGSNLLYTLNITGVIRPGATCDPDDIMFTCSEGYECDGTTRTCELAECHDDTTECPTGYHCEGSVQVCEPAACYDGIDNDGDGLIDFPHDPGCRSPGDNSEIDSCPGGVGCPACGNQLDDDSDGFTDFPADSGCLARGDLSEDKCPLEQDGIDVITHPLTSGTTVGRSHDSTPSCRLPSTSPDKVYALRVPGLLRTLSVDTITSGYDTTIHIKRGSCDAPDLACDDDSGGSLRSMMFLTDVAAGYYLIFIDGWGANTAGSFNLNVRGTFAAGEPCDPAQISTGLFECPPGMTCRADGSNLDLRCR